jgi:hypothetical protein
MSYVNYIVIDSLKIKFQISRNIREEEIDDILHNISRIFEESENMPEDTDIFHEKHHSPFTKNFLDLIAYKFLSTVYSSQDISCFFDYLLIGWIKNNDIEYRIISEYSLDNEDEPAKDYLTIGG